MATDRERMSGFARGANAAQIKGFPLRPYGQSCPQHYPQSRELGQPLSIRETAALIGCSAWTVRQAHVPAGLPCFRSGPNGKLIFYRDQVVAWILEQQKKGGR